MDKVKVQAEKAKIQAQDLKGKVGERVEEVQSKRKADDLLCDLGRYVYAERTGRPMAEADAEMARIVAQLKGLEDEGVTVVTTTPPTEPPPAPEG
jgi:hypothetical protein